LQRVAHSGLPLIGRHIVVRVAGLQVAHQRLDASARGFELGERLKTTGNRFRRELRDLLRKHLDFGDVFARLVFLGVSLVAKVEIEEEGRDRQHEHEAE